MKVSELNFKLQNSETCFIISQIFDEPINIKNQVNANGIVFANCTFSKYFRLNNTLIELGIKFINCSFDELTVKDTSIASYNDSFNTKYASIVISSCEIKRLIFEGNNSIERGVLIDESSNIDRLSVQSIKSNEGGFTFDNIKINEQFDFFNSHLANSLEFSNCSINSKVNISELTASDISFINSTILKDLSINNSNLNGIIFNNGQFKDELNFRANKIKENLSIVNAEFNQTFNVDLNKDNQVGSINEIYISSSKFKGDLILNGYNQTIKKAQIDFSKQLDGSIFLNSCLFEELELKGVNYNSSLFLNLCNFHTFNIQDFYNYSSLTISSSAAYDGTAILNILNSSLGKFGLFNIDLTKFSEVNIVDSTLLDMITANVKWFNHGILNKKVKADDRYAQNKEIFRQLKFISEKQGNRIDSLEFKALEIDSYRHEINHPFKWFSKKFFTSNLLNRIILCLGQTNNFGLNWLKPTCLILLFSVIFYCLIVVGTSDLLSYIPNFTSGSIILTLKVFYNYLPALPQLMNPAHNIGNIFPNAKHLSFTVHFLDYSLKLFLAFFIFQIISAFRKYMK